MKSDGEFRCTARIFSVALGRPQRVYAATEQNAFP
jgi:hypothetical protein